VERLLFVVKDVFALGFGLVLAPGAPSDFDVRVGDPIELRPPDDAEPIRTTIASIPMICSRDPVAVNRGTPIALSRSVKKEHVPIGTEVWVRIRP
jgi:hypothetical protein